MSQSACPWNVLFAEAQAAHVHAARSAVGDKNARTFARDVLEDTGVTVTAARPRTRHDPAARA